MVDCGLWAVDCGGVWRWTDIQGMENIIAWRVWGLGMYCVVLRVHSLLSFFSYFVLRSYRLYSRCRLSEYYTYILCTRYNN